MPSPKLPPLIVAAVMYRGEGRCAYCDRGWVALTVDHLLPRKWGGDELDPTNLVPCCWDCNGLKGTMDHVAFLDMIDRMRPRNPPAMQHIEPFDSEARRRLIDEQVKWPLNFDAARRILARQNENRNAARRAEREAARAEREAKKPK